MVICALCDFENIAGVDTCRQCGQSLSESHLLAPKNAVERGLLVDTIAKLWPKSPIVVPADATVAQVLDLMVGRSIGSVFVVDGEQMVGVFTERDALLRLNVDAASLANEPISRFMTPNPQALSGNARLAFAVHRMDLGGYRHVPVVDDEERLRGVISVRDILRYLAGKIAESGADRK